LPSRSRPLSALPRKRSKSIGRAEHVQRRAREAYRRFKDNPNHPSLRFKQVHATQPVYAARVGLGHRALAIIDGETVITGSFNFTTAAEQKHAENLLVIHDTVLAARYTENWRAHAAHSARTLGR